MHAKQVPGPRRDPADRRGDFADSFGRDAGGLVAAVPDRGRARPSWSPWARCSAAIAGGRRRPARRGRRRSARSASPASALADRRGAATRWRAPRRVIVVEKAFAVGAGGIVGQNVRLALGRHRRPPCTTSWPASAADRSPGRRCARLFDDVLADRHRRRTRCTSWTSTASWSSASSPGPATAARPHAEHMLRALGHRSVRDRTEEPMPWHQEIKLYQVGTFVAGNRLLDLELRSVQAHGDRSNSITSGHRACQGCGEVLGARYVLDAAMRATDGDTGRRERHRLPRGLLDAVPGVVVADPVAALALRQRPRGRRRDGGRPAGPGPRRHPGRRPGRRRRHRRHRLRLPVGHVRAQRRRAVRLLRQPGLHEHRRAALRRDPGRRAHREHQGRSDPSRATPSGRARSSRRSRWPTRSRTSPPRPSPTCTTSSTRSRRR